MKIHYLVVSGLVLALSAGCTSSGQAKRRLDAPSVASGGTGGRETYDQAVSRETMRLLKLDNSLTVKDATKLAEKNLDKSQFPIASNPADQIEASRQEKKKAAQKDFEQKLAKSLKE